MKVKYSLSRDMFLCSDITVLPQIPGVPRPSLQPLPGFHGPLDCQLGSIMMEEDLGGLEITSWPHVRAANGKANGSCSIRPRRREIRSSYCKDSAPVTPAVKIWFYQERNMMSKVCSLVKDQ